MIAPRTRLFFALPYVFVELGPTKLLLALLSVLLDFLVLLMFPMFPTTCVALMSE